jgi:hypothetical protein
VDKPITTRHLEEGVKAFRPSGHGQAAPYALQRAWADEWLDGPPGHVRPETVALDLQLYAHAYCGRCKRRTLTVKPQRRRRGDYRVLATCRNCKFEESF